MVLRRLAILALTPVFTAIQCFFFFFRLQVVYRLLSRPSFRTSTDVTFRCSDYAYFFVKVTLIPFSNLNKTCREPGVESSEVRHLFKFA